MLLISLEGELFKKYFIPFLCAAISKGEFTVFKCFKNLYKDSLKVKDIEEVLLELLRLLNANLPFPGM